MGSPEEPEPSETVKITVNLRPKAQRARERLSRRGLVATEAVNRGLVLLDIVTELEVSGGKLTFTTAEGVATDIVLL